MDAVSKTPKTILGRRRKGKKRMNDWKGFRFPMGFFVVVRENRTVIGKWDPLTGKIIEWYELCS